MDVQERPTGPDLSGLRIDDRARNGRGARRRPRTALLAALALVAVAVAVLALRGRATVVETAAAKPAGEAGRTTLLNASGYVTPRRRATVAAKITARVLDVLVDEGMDVAEGQVLARLDASDAERRLRAAETARDATAALIANLEVNLANSERELRRQQELEKAGFAAVQERETAQTTVDSLRAQIAAGREQVKAADAQIGVARQDVENCTVRAPFAGVVVSKDAQVGEMVSPISAGGGFTRTGIATIVDMASLEIEVDVNESYIARVRPGQKVDAVLDAYPDWRIPSKVRTVIPTADRQKATVKVRISFDKLDPRILPDMGVKVAFLADETAGGVQAAVPRALVPQAAVREDNGKKVVFVVRDGRLERRAVTVGEGRGGNLEIMAGVAAGDAVVIQGPEGLRDGQRVKVK
ncbi:MAG TPA: efflux RND transporter periplasmic adaptor subunit [Terriglobales bacterium]|nr:efflux RND transporter periplasmic adaptor subunit [Terriglobales bacterium]